MARAPREMLRPYQQGGLDALCGPYAVINALRLVVAPYRRLHDTACRELFAELAQEFAGRGHCRRMLTEGCGRKSMVRLLRRGQSWLADKEGIAVTVTRPFGGSDKHAPKQVLAVLTAHLNRPGYVAIIGTPEHWSVASGLSQGRLVLFDSDGRVYKKIAQGNGRGAIMQLDPGRTFLITPA